jgi:hypothetical protein
MSRNGPATQLHPRERTETVPDPKIEHGPFKVIRRVDWKAVVVDRRRPWNDRRVGDVHGSAEFAGAAARELFEVAKAAGERLEWSE